MKLIYERLFNLGHYENHKIGVEMDSEDVNKDFPKLVETVFLLHEQATIEEERAKSAATRAQRIRELREELEAYGDRPQLSQ